jgi:hypothetical protein
VALPPGCAKLSTNPARTNWLTRRSDEPLEALSATASSAF